MNGVEELKSQSAEQAQANIDALFAVGSVPAHVSNKEDVKAVHLSPENGDILSELPIALLDDFSTGADRQPFRPYSPQELEELKDDIIQNGLLQPPIVRPKEGGRYEIIAGHNRRTGAKETGYTTIPCIIRNLTDEEAILQMVSTNLRQRKKLLPSEKAWAYKMQLDAMRRQGFRTDLTSPQVAARSRSDDRIGDSAGESGDTVQRYIRLTHLTPELLAHVDAGALGLTIGATLSYLSLENQVALEKYCFADHRVYIGQELADALRQADADGTIFSDGTLPLLVQLAIKSKGKMAVSEKVLRRYFPRATTRKAVEKTVSAALKQYFEQGGTICE